MGDIVKGPADHLVVGDFNADCSISGFKRKASQLVKNWQGQYRIPEFNEPRQPQDFVRGVQDIQTPPWIQRPKDTFVQVCTFNGRSAIPGLAIPGCMIPGNPVFDQSFYPPLPPQPFQLSDDGFVLTTDDGRVIVSDIGGVPLQTPLTTDDGYQLMTDDFNPLVSDP